MKKTSRILVVAISCMMLFTSCKKGSDSSSSGENSSASPTTQKLIGENLKYDLNAPVNEGKKIELTIWTDPEIEPFYKEATDKYSKIHDNVSFKIVTQPWSDYWTKLPLTLSSGAGPDIYRAHEAFVNNLKQFSRELPADVFPMGELKADFPAIEELVVDGKYYSVPLGSTFGGGIYYNKKMWADAGLTEKDIPKTWDKFIENGKKLTKADAKGNVTQYGFSTDHAFEAFVTDLNYQKGQPLFKDDMFTWDLNNDVMYENISFIKSLKDEHKFMMYSDGDCEDQFGHGQVAMIYQRNWLAGYVNDTYPEIDWGYFLMPTQDGNAPPAYGNKSNEWTMSVASKDDKKAAVSFDFFKYFLCENETYLNNALRLSAIPGKQNLKSDARLNDYENLVKMGQVDDRLVYTGVIPTDEARQKALRAAGSDIFINGKDAKNVIPKVEKDLMADTAKNKFTYKSIEDKYKYFAELNK
ncbi:MAG: extracellular solute-binding protein [Oscillospiraceae bacterium]